MPRTRPLTESQRTAARWHEQDDAFYEQFERIRKMSGMTKGKLAEYLGLSVPTMLKYAQQPDEMPKKIERRLVLLAEKAGLTYDPALGGGKRSAQPGIPAGVTLTIDPETGYLKAITA